LIPSSRSSCIFSATRNKRKIFRNGYYSPENQGFHTYEGRCQPTFDCGTHQLNSNNSITIQIKSAETLLGTLGMSRGSAEWWPRGNRVNTLRKSCKSFASMLDQSMK
jgi:hypothetical protein